MGELAPIVQGGIDAPDRNEDLKYTRTLNIRSRRLYRCLCLCFVSTDAES